MPSDLITFVVIAYQQEHFVREALEAALAQTYSPLEVLVLDDASTDRTADVIEETIRSYTGPHAVRFDRNDRNVGMREQLNHAAREARGGLLVHAAGDDVSHPARVERAAALWGGSDGDVYVVCSNARVIDRDGAEIGVLLDSSYAPPRSWQQLAMTSEAVPGCTLSWDRRLFHLFGEVPLYALEDAVVCMRALLAGRFAYDPQPSVSYRRHGNNTSAWSGDRGRDSWDDYRWWTARYCRDRAALTRAWLKDIEVHLGRHPEQASGAQVAVQALHDMLEVCEIRAQLSDGSAKRVADLQRLWRARRTTDPRLLGTTALWLLSPAAYRYARKLLDAVR